MKRKLVTIRQVKELIPIEGADFIELAKIDGWQCVVKIGEFAIGDWGVYYEVDSFLPIEHQYEFLRKNCYKKMVDGSEGFRLRTIRLKKKLSQGLLLPISIKFENCFGAEVKLGDDVTERLGVKLYEPLIPAELVGVVKGMFPSFIPKTDEERIQNLVDEIPFYDLEFFEVTEKLDGTSCTIYFDGEDFGVCSHNIELKESETNVFWKIANQYSLKEKLGKLYKRVAIQGEVIGEGIQKNKYALTGQDLYVFNIYDIGEACYMAPAPRRKLVELLGLKHAPVVFTGISHTHMNVDEYLKIAEGKSLLNLKQEREGIVFKHINFGKRYSFKVINNNYLLGEKE